jgi:23S rRNA (cytosine1962-C5)-methyltransferase
LVPNALPSVPMPIPEFRLKPGKEARLARGHAWAFRNELDFQQKDAGPGAWVRLLTAKGRPLGAGFLNTASSLCFRLIAPHGSFPLEAGPEEVLRARLAQAYALRGARVAGEARRLVNGEGDWLSGLVVDDFNGVLVLQMHSAGMDKHRGLIEDTLKALPGTKALVERSDAGFRQKESLLAIQGLRYSAALDGDFLERVPFVEDGRQYTADVLDGLKTGFFLDQRPARTLAQSLAQGRRCLDLFSHSGGFSVAMALGYATEVTALDQSAEALELAKGHARLNRVEDKLRLEQADVFTRLREMEKAGEKFGLIVLDPPALAKDGEAVGGALRGYKELNLRALRLLEPGGLLLTCSCTQVVSESQFHHEVQAAAADAPATLRELARLGAGPDHPRLLGMDETHYLKCLLLRKD